MRDGVDLAANIFRPDKPGKYPVLVVRTPYGKHSGQHFGFGRFFAGKDYVYVVEDSRGRHDSEGTFHGMHDEAEDGYDTIEWAAAQPWSDGNVGTMGGSYGGENQWMAAVTRPPHLKAMLALVSPPGPWYNIPFQYGALTLLTLDWDIMTSGHASQPSRELGLDQVITKLPLVTLDEVAAGKAVPLWKANFFHPTYDDYWKLVDYERRWDKVDVPVLHISGWYDDDQPGTFRNFTAMRRLGRKGQRMMIGPWPHAINSVTKMGILDFGAASQIDLQATMLRWFDTLAEGEGQRRGRGAPVRVFVMGANTWRDEAEWPLPATQWTKYYFHSGGKANTLSGDGALSPAAPKKEPPGPLRLRSGGPDPVRYARLERPGRRTRRLQVRRGTEGRPRLYDAPVRAGHGADGAPLGQAVRLLIGPRHRLERHAHGRLSRRLRPPPQRRRHPGELPGIVREPLPHRAGQDL